MSIISYVQHLVIHVLSKCNTNGTMTLTTTCCSEEVITTVALVMADVFICYSTILQHPPIHNCAQFLALSNCNSGSLLPRVTTIIYSCCYFTQSGPEKFKKF